MDLDVGEEHSFAVQRSMNGALWQLNGLVDPEVSADATAADQLESSICTAIYDLGNLAASPGTRMGSFLPSTARLVEACELGAVEEGLGVVVKASDSETGAFKTLQQEEDELNYRVLREAYFMAACRGHPSLVNLSAVGRDPRTGEYCLVMEHVGPSLYDVMVNSQQGFFPERDVRRIMHEAIPERGQGDARARRSPPRHQLDEHPRGGQRRRRKRRRQDRQLRGGRVHVHVGAERGL
jgi:hypothetical protein